MMEPCNDTTNLCTVKTWHNQTEDHRYDGMAVMPANCVEGSIIRSYGKNWLCYPAPAAPDYHPWIIAALVLALVWLWVLGAFMTWVGSARNGWLRRGFTGAPSHRHMLEAWRWRFAVWPLWPFRGKTGPRP